MSSYPAKMLVARTASGEQVEATLELDRCPDYTCPTCGELVVLKRGTSVISHFAHKRNENCTSSGESIRHMKAKMTLARGFRSVGYHVELEAQHPEVGRRVDVSVTVPTGKGEFRVAVEVQDSPIDPEAMRSRERADRNAGFFGTLWVFTKNREPAFPSDPPYDEVRVPDEQRWLWNRYRVGVHMIDEDDPTGWLRRYKFADIVRPGEEYPAGWDEIAREMRYEHSPARKLKATKRVEMEFPTYRLTCVPGRFHSQDKPEWCVIFGGDGLADLHGTRT